MSLMEECYGCGKEVPTHDPRNFIYCPKCCAEGEGRCIKCNAVIEKPTWSQKFCGGSQCLADKTETTESNKPPVREPGVPMTFNGRNGGRLRGQGAWTDWAYGYALPGDTITYMTSKGRIRKTVVDVLWRRYRKFDETHETRCYCDEKANQWLDIQQYQEQEQHAMKAQNIERATEDDEDWERKFLKEMREAPPEEQLARLNDIEDKTYAERQKARKLREQLKDKDYRAYDGRNGRKRPLHLKLPR